MSTTIAPTAKGKGWWFQVTALAVVLGMLLAMALRTQRKAASEGIPDRWPVLKAEFRNLKQENSKLQKDLADYQKRYEDLVRRQPRGEATESLGAVLNQTKLFAGTVTARGSGVIITLRDSTKLDVNETRPDVVEQYVVHDSDIRAVTNELFAAGAEVVSINGQRLVANSSIRCVGPVVLVNSVQVAPPYIIRAIGQPEALQAAIELPGGVADELFPLDMIEVRKQPDIVVPAFTGSTRFNSAHPVAQRGRRG